MTKLRIYRPGHGFREEDGLDGLHSLLNDGRSVTWVMMHQPSDEELGRLASILNLHPLTVEDLQADGDRPNLRRHGDHLSIIFYALNCPDADREDLPFIKVGAIAGSRFVVTVTWETAYDLEEAYTTWHGNADRLPSDGAGPLYAVLDTIVDGYFPIIDDIAERVDDVEDRVVERRGETSLSVIFALKKNMLRFRRLAAGSRDVVNALLRHDDLFDSDSSIFFQDVYDHTVRITDSVDTYRDLLSNAMDTYLTVVSNQMAESANRLNETMQTLTAWSIVIGSSAVITGFYGMNVDNLPGTQGKNGLALAILMMVVTAFALLAYFRRKRWI